MASSFEVPAGGDQLFRTQLLAPEGQPSRAEAALGEDVETRAAAAAAPAIWEKAPRRVVVAGSAVQADEAARRVARVVIRSIMVREGFCLIPWQSLLAINESSTVSILRVRAYELVL